MIAQNQDVVRENLEQIQHRIALAISKAGRSHGSVELVVVSKGQSVDTMRHAAMAGVKIFGENYPEETLGKITGLTEFPVQWHMIGHLQSRKAKIVAESFDYLHSLDSLRLAEKLNGILTEKKRKLPVLLEINIAGEDSKSGWVVKSDEDFDRFLPDFDAILKLPNLDLRGLMTMPPLTDHETEARQYFSMLREVLDKLNRSFSGINMDQLSMGTSSDFEWAILEGATMVRIGTAILGPRPRKV